MLTQSGNQIGKYGNIKTMARQLFVQGRIVGEDHDSGRSATHISHY
jgi:hypothetical protein